MLVDFEVTLKYRLLDFCPKAPAEIAVTVCELQRQEAANEIALSELAKIRGPFSLRRTFFFGDRPDVIWKRVSVVGRKAVMRLAAVWADKRR